MSNPILQAMESTGVRPLVSVTAQVPLEPKQTYAERRLMAEIGLRSQLQEKCQATLTLDERTETHHEGGFVTAMTGELVVMTKAQWAKLLGAVYRAGRESNVPPQPEAPQP